MRHYPPMKPQSPSGTWNPDRDLRVHKRWARAVKKRDGGQCVLCGSTENIRAAHIIPLAQGGGYILANGRSLCRRHDMETDKYAR